MLIIIAKFIFYYKLTAMVCKTVILNSKYRRLKLCYWILFVAQYELEYYKKFHCDLSQLNLEKHEEILQHNMRCSMHYSIQYAIQYSMHYLMHSSIQSFSMHYSIKYYIQYSLHQYTHYSVHYSINYYIQNCLNHSMRYSIPSHSMNYSINYYMQYCLNYFMHYSIHYFNFLNYLFAEGFIHWTGI